MRRAGEGVEAALEALLPIDLSTLKPYGPRYSLLLDEVAADPACLDDDPAALVEVEVRGEAFLQNMVRIMVGTLVEVGLGRRAPAWVATLLARPDRQRSGATAPPEGLTLVEVLWPKVWPPTDGVAALAREAIAVYRAAPGTHTREQAEVEAWLRAHER